MHRSLRVVAILACLLAALARPIGAQTLRGVVRDSASSTPVAGAVVMLLDSSGTVLRRNLTDERGQYRIAFSSGARTLRFIHIGLQPRTLSLAVPPDFSASLDASMLPLTTTLSAVRVEDRSECPRRKDELAAFGLWEQARTGLLATIVAREANPASMSLLVFVRRLQRVSERITQFTVDPRTSERSGTSFNAAFSAQAFTNSGFANDSAGTQLLFGPDAEVLLDASFASAYCFRIADPSRTRPRQVGLAFAPAHRRDGRVDIDGTLWIDTAARVLTEIEFRYLGLPSVTDPLKPGGRVSFRQMQNGVVLIDQWHLRTVVAGPEKLAWSKDAVAHEDLNPIEFGGELARASWASGLTWHASLGMLRIRAATGSAKPSAGTVLGLANTRYRATVDSNGVAEIPDLLPGPYSVEIIDPRLAELGIGIPTHVQFTAARDSTFEASMIPMTTEEFVTSRCVTMHQFTSGAAVLILGRVMTPAGEPVNGARVSYAIKKGGADWAPLREHYETGSDGTFQACNAAITPNSIVRITVERRGLPDQESIVALSSKLTIVPIRVPPAP
jgi:hypothetical protein